MFLSQALDRLQGFSPEHFGTLSEVLSPELLTDCLQKSGAVTVRKRRLPLEMMVWSVVGMALYRHLPMSHIVNQLDILLPGKRPFVAPSAVVQARQRLGEAPVREVFEQTQSPFGMGRRRIRTGTACGCWGSMGWYGARRIRRRIMPPSPVPPTSRGRRLIPKCAWSARWS